MASVSDVSEAAQLWRLLVTSVRLQSYDDC
jgi:hypothetical protein